MIVGLSGIDQCLSSHSKTAIIRQLALCRINKWGCGEAKGCLTSLCAMTTRAKVSIDLVLLRLEHQRKDKVVQLTLITLSESRSQNLIRMWSTPVFGCYNGPAVCVLTDDPRPIKAKGRTNHLTEVPSLIALKAGPTTIGCKRISNMTIVCPNNNFGALEMSVDAQEGGGHVLIPSIP